MDQATEDSVALMVFFGIIGMLVLALAIILFFVIYQRRLFAQQENIRAMQLDHQRALLESFIQAQEAERKRIAQNLHDGIGALLSASRMYINRLPTDGKMTNDIGFIRQETGGLIDETIDNIRNITRNLLPTSLERFGLIAATEDLCKRINDLGELEMKFQYTQEKRFDVQQEFALYRIVQELTNNTLKYAEASEINIQIHIIESMLKLTYQDNGKGFDLQEWKNNPHLQNGLGLRGIQARAEVLKTKFTLQSEKNNGFFGSLELRITPEKNDQISHL